MGCGGSSIGDDDMLVAEEGDDIRLEEDDFLRKPGQFRPSGEPVLSGPALFKCQYLPWRKMHLILYGDSTLAWFYDERDRDPLCYVKLKTVHASMVAGQECLNVRTTPREIPRGYSHSTMLYVPDEPRQGHRGREYALDIWFLFYDRNTFNEWLDSISSVLPGRAQPQQNSRPKPGKPRSPTGRQRQQHADLGDTIREHRKTFSMMDTNKDGLISRDEFRNFARSLGQKPSEQELTDMIKKADMDGDGQINFEEFLQVMGSDSKKSTSSEEQQLRESFAVYDRNGDGQVSREEMMQTMAALGGPMSDADADEFMRQCDLDGDGYINYEEFKRSFLN